MDKVRFNQAELYRVFESPVGPVARVVLQEAERRAAFAKSIAPVRTGRLRSEIHVEALVPVRGRGVSVGVVSGAPYSKYPEKRRHFMARAASNEIREGS